MGVPAPTPAFADVREKYFAEGFPHVHLQMWGEGTPVSVPPTLVVGGGGKPPTGDYPAPEYGLEGVCKRGLSSTCRVPQVRGEQTGTSTDVPGVRSAVLCHMAAQLIMLH